MQRTPHPHFARKKIDKCQRHNRADKQNGVEQNFTSLETSDKDSVKAQRKSHIQVNQYLNVAFVACVRGANLRPSSYMPYFCAEFRRDLANHESKGDSFWLSLFLSPIHLTNWQAPFVSLQIATFITLFAIIRFADVNTNNLYGNNAF